MQKYLKLLTLVLVSLFGSSLKAPGQELTPAQQAIAELRRAVGGISVGPKALLEQLGQNPAVKEAAKMIAEAQSRSFREVLKALCKHLAATGQIRVGQDGEITDDVIAHALNAAGQLCLGGSAGEIKLDDSDLNTYIWSKIREVMIYSLLKPFPRQGSSPEENLFDCYWPSFFDLNSGDQKFILAKLIDIARILPEPPPEFYRYARRTLFSRINYFIGQPTKPDPLTYRKICNFIFWINLRILSTDKIYAAYGNIKPLASFDQNIRDLLLELFSD